MIGCEKILRLFAFVFYICKSFISPAYMVDITIGSTGIFLYNF